MTESRVITPTRIRILNPPAHASRSISQSLPPPTYASDSTPSYSMSLIAPTHLSLALLMLLLPPVTLGWVPVCSRSHSRLATRSPSLQLVRSASTPFADELSEPDEGRFGRREYWDNAYRSGDLDDSNTKGDASTFSWYCNWEDLEPFFADCCPDRDAAILVPGIGNDAAIRGMFDAGYENLSAFDYAPEGVECARKMFGDDRLEKIDLRVADARNLVEYHDSSFDAVLEKGTLDSIYLSGGKDKEKAKLHLAMAVSELSRVVKGGGVVFSVTAACTKSVQEAFSDGEGIIWRQIRDGDFYMTEDGYASTNVDATMLAWERI